jgi:divalent metal cation (Fe/Co/Zn/Cd) transporter
MTELSESPGTEIDLPRRELVRRGLTLNYATIGYNSFEAVVALLVGVVSGSVAVVGFGLDSVIEVTASGAAQWRLRADIRPAQRERVERLSLRIIGWSFLVLAAYIASDSARALWRHEVPDRSVVGIVILSLSVIVMPVLARAKRNVARAMMSRALEADAAQTSLCAYLSAIALAGVALNALFGWWWADPLAALAMLPIIVKEGLEGLRGEPSCADGCC